MPFRLFPLLAVASSFGAGEAVRCPERPPLVLPAAATGLADLEAGLRRDLAAVAGPCRPPLELALGQTLLGAGRAEEALAPLTRAAIHGDDGVRPAAFAELGRAHGLAGSPYAALRALAMAERLAGGDPAVATTAHERATLLARLHLRRGGTAWGTYRFHPGGRVVLDKRLEDPRIVVARHGLPVVLGRRQLLDLGDGAPLPAAGARPRAVAVGPRGLVGLLDDGGRLELSTGDGVDLEPPAGRGRLAPDGLALGAADEAFVIDRGRVQVFDAGGRHLRTLAVPTDAVAVASDGRGRLHVLREKRGGLVLFAGDGTVRAEVKASGEGWDWSRADALAADDAGGSYVLVRETGSIYVFDPKGELVGRIDPPADDLRLLRRARSLAIGPTGEVLVLLADALVVYR